MPCTGGGGYLRHCGVGCGSLRGGSRGEASNRGRADTSIAHVVNHDQFYHLRTAGGVVGRKSDACAIGAGVEGAIALLECYKNNACPIAISQVGRELPRSLAAVLWTVGSEVHLANRTGEVSHL